MIETLKRTYKTLCDIGFCASKAKFSIDWLGSKHGSSFNTMLIRERGTLAPALRLYARLSERGLTKLATEVLEAAVIEADRRVAD